MQFEYQVKHLPLDFSGDTYDDGVTIILNSAGETGWELVSVIQDPNRKSHGLFYFKKQID